MAVGAGLYVASQIKSISQAIVIFVCFLLLLIALVTEWLSARNRLREAMRRYEEFIREHPSIKDR